jgi:hypothetical protein
VISPFGRNDNIEDYKFIKNEQYYRRLEKAVQIRWNGPKVNLLEYRLLLGFVGIFLPIQGWCI